jgi:hypothetical protein
VPKKIKRKKNMTASSQPGFAASSADRTERSGPRASSAGETPLFTARSSTDVEERKVPVYNRDAPFGAPRVVETRTVPVEETDIFDSRNRRIASIPQEQLWNAGLTGREVAETFAAFSKKLDIKPETASQEQRTALNQAVSQARNVYVRDR